MENIKRDVRWWLNIATIAAFSALIILICEYWISPNNWIHWIVVGITSTFFLCAVLWWYWAIMKIAAFSKYIIGLKTVIDDLKKDLKEIHKDLK
jgi:hypothetical protein